LVAPLGKQDLADMLFEGLGEATKPRVEPLVLEVPRRALAWMSRKLDRRTSSMGRKLSLEAAEAILKGSENGLLWKLSGKQPPNPMGLGDRLDHLLGKDEMTPDEEAEVARILDGRGDVIIASELEEDK
jgi:hypothetical protein